MKPNVESGVSITKQGKEWKAVCPTDKWDGTYQSYKSAVYGSSAHKRGKWHRQNNGDWPEKSTIVESGPIESLGPSFKDAIRALAAAREAYEDSLNSFLR